MDDLISRRPYLIRALYDWVLDNGLTPHLLVAADAPGVYVPTQFVTDDGKITLNINPNAVRGLTMDNDLICFSARFSGANFDIAVPPGAVLALYARENGEGMLFGEVEYDEVDSQETLVDSSRDESSSHGNQSDGSSGKSRSHLRVIK